MTTKIHTLFDPDAPEESLLRLAEVFGEAQVFRMIGFIRDTRTAGGNAAGRIRHLLAKKMVEDRMAETGCDHDTAQLELALELGYDGNPRTRSNFYAIVRGQVRNGGIRQMYDESAG